jgi:hypothetical protein
LIFFYFVVGIENEKLAAGACNFIPGFITWFNNRRSYWGKAYFLRYIISFASFTARGTSGNAAATRLGA